MVTDKDREAVYFDPAIIAILKLVTPSEGIIVTMGTAALENKPMLVSFDEHGNFQGRIIEASEFYKDTPTLSIGINDESGEPWK